MSERGFFSRITEPITDRVRDSVDSVEEKIKNAIQAQTDKVKAAAQAKAEAYAPSFISFGVAGVLTWLGVLSLVAAAILGLSEVLHPALAAVVVSAVLFVIAGILGAYGKWSLPKDTPTDDKAPVTPALRQQDESVDHFWTD